MGILSNTLCIILIACTALLSSAQNTNPILYGMPECLTGFTDTDTDVEWLTGTSTPYSLAYTCGLSEDNAARNPDGSIKLTIDDTASSGFSHSCGEVISQQMTKWGAYTCMMKAQGVAGTVQSCQIASTTRSPFEMIYFAFIGNVTDAVFPGYFVNGRFQSFGMQALEFDASLKPHNYTIQWASQYIIWYVDGTPLTQIYTTTQLPQWPNRFIQNFVLDAEDGTNGDWHGLNTNGIFVDRNFAGLPDDEPISVTISGRIYTPDVQVACEGEPSINPGDGGNYIDTQDCTMQQVLAIYDEKYQNKWTNAGSQNNEIGSNKNGYAGNQVHSGNDAIKWTLYPNPGGSVLYFNSPESFTAEDYWAVAFWINGGQQGQQSILANLIVSEDGALSDSIDLTNYVTTGLVAFKWTRIVMPLSSFGNPSPDSNYTIYGFVLSANDIFGGVVFVDDVYLIQRYPICANDTLVIYDDSLNKAFNNGSWSDVPQTFNSRNTDKVYEGDYSLSWRLNFNSGVKLQIAKGSIPSKYTALSFWMSKTDRTTLQNVVVYMTTQGSTLPGSAAGAGPINIQEFYGGVLPYTDWFRVVIPFYEFGITSTTQLQAIVLNCQTGNGQYDGIAYIDNLEFIAEERASTPKSSSASLVFGPFTLLVSFLLTVIYML